MKPPDARQHRQVDRRRRARRIGSLALVYLATGIFGLHFAHYHDGATLVWPPTGVSLAVLILFGVRMWPGVALGSLLVNFTATDLPPVAGVGIAIGNTLEPIVGAVVLKRYANFRPQLDRVRDVIVLLTVGAIGCTIVSATFGVASLAATGQLRGFDPGLVWLIWWLGDAGGAIIMTPAILIAAHGSPGWRELIRNPEFVAAVGLVLAVNAWVAFDTRTDPTTSVLDVFALLTLYPAVVWAGIRTGSRGAMLVAFTGMLLSTLGMAGNASPFLIAETHDNMMLLWSYNITLAIIALSLANAIGQRDQAEWRYRVEEAQRRASERGRLLLRERERMTREMHDGIGGQLVSTISMLEIGEPKTAEVIESLRRALDDMRIVIDSLDPNTTDLPTALARLRARLEPLLRRNRIELNWRVPELPGLEQCSLEATLHIVRIIQEAVTNALRHSGASAIDIDIGLDPDRKQGLVIEIRDDGRLGPTEPDRSGRGLHNMRTRADELAAELEIGPAAPGTRVRLRLDLGSV